MSALCDFFRVIAGIATIAVTILIIILIFRLRCYIEIVECSPVHVLELQSPHSSNEDEQPKPGPVRIDDQDPNGPTAGHLDYARLVIDSDTYCMPAELNEDVDYDEGELCQFAQIVGCSRALARRYFALAQGDLDSALQLFDWEYHTNRDNADDEGAGEDAEDGNVLGNVSLVQSASDEGYKGDWDASEASSMGYGVGRDDVVEY